MKADVAMTASPPTAVASAFAARVLAQVTNWYATGTASWPCDSAATGRRSAR